MSQRFSVRSELNRVDRGLVDDAQKIWGQSVEWFRYDEDASNVNDLYDVGAERRWKKPLLIPALWVIREEGRATYNQEGLYTVDSLQLAVAKTVLRDRLHWVDMPHSVESFLEDRIRFEGEVFTITSFQLQGKLLDRDTVVGISANKVRDDQYFFDPDFAPFEGSGSMETLGSLAGTGESPL